jgi:long-chain acyl-CoA synthetase
LIDPLNSTFGEMFLDVARRHASRPAVTLDDRTLTYAELAGAVGALQAGLTERGVRPGDRLAMLFPNTPHFHIAFFAAQSCGAEVVPLNCLHSLTELCYIIDNSQAKWLLALNVFDEKVAAVARTCPRLQAIVVAGPSTVPSAVSFEGLIGANLGKPPIPAERSPEDIALLLYTSGTEGRPKGAMLTHRNVLWDAAATNTMIDIREDDVLVGPLPLFHAFGLLVDLALAVMCGAHTVLMPKFAGNTTLELIEAHRATVFAGVPTMFTIMLRSRRTPDYDLSSLRLAASGGAPLPLEVMHEFVERFGTVFLEGYGPTEAAPVVSLNPLVGVRKVGTVGPCLPGMEVCVVDDDDNALACGEVGELLARGPNVMLGYWDAPEATETTLRGGWLHTGDLARLDEDGYITIVDRKKDMIIVGGMNVYPREVEDAMYEVPGVIEAAVVGVPSAVKGEDVVAFVALAEGAEVTEAQIMAHCRERLASFKMPREIHIEAELPKSSIGKILRREVRDLARARVGARR